MNIDLEKYGLKEAKFADLIDGEEFNIPADVGCLHNFDFYRRKLVGDKVIYANGSPMAIPENVTMYTEENGNDLVFVKV